MAADLKSFWLKDTHIPNYCLCRQTNALPRRPATSRVWLVDGSDHKPAVRAEDRLGAEEPKNQGKNV
jgi:hypothetical protein